MNIGFVHDWPQGFPLCPSIPLYAIFLGGKVCQFASHTLQEDALMECLTACNVVAFMTWHGDGVA